MKANQIVTAKDIRAIREYRHQLHRNPEPGFDLPRTTAFVQSKPDALQIPRTDRYAQSSVVA